MRGRQWIDGEMYRLLAVCSALDRNRLTAQHRKWLRLLLGGIVRGEDVRDRFFKKRGRGEHAGKRAAEIGARDYACALHIAIRSLPACADRITVAKAKLDAEGKFGMNEEQVRRAWLKYSANARDLAEQLHEIPEAQLVELMREIPDLVQVEVREIPDLVHSSKRK